MHHNDGGLARKCVWALGEILTNCEVPNLICSNWICAGAGFKPGKLLRPYHENQFHRHRRSVPSSPHSKLIRVERHGHRVIASIAFCNCLLNVASKYRTESRTARAGSRTSRPRCPMLLRQATNRSKRSGHFNRPRLGRTRARSAFAKRCKLCVF